MVQAMANTGERAGFTIKQIIELLNLRLTAETLLHLIGWRLHHPMLASPNSARWIM
jgi:hypothetical protein